MNPLVHRRGTTLLELTVVLMIVGILTGMAAPPLRRAMDTLAVRAARDAILAAVARTRATAVARGSAALVVDLPRGRIWIESPPGRRAGPSTDLAADYRVRLTASNPDAERVTLRFDGLGLGRVANIELRTRRGEAVAGVSVSSYGRARPW